MTSLLIAGATGLVGSLALQQALADPRITRVIALTRRPIPPADKMENVVADFAALPADADWWQVDGVVCALGTTRARTPSPALYRRIDHDYPLALARHARAHGATRFALVSSLGANPRSPFAYTRMKGELEEALQRISYPSLTILRPSVLAGPREDYRFAERMGAALFHIAAPLIPVAWRVSPAQAVAATLIEGAVTADPGVHVRDNRTMRRAP